VTGNPGDSANLVISNFDRTRRKDPPAASIQSPSSLRLRSSGRNGDSPRQIEQGRHHLLHVRRLAQVSVGTGLQAFHTVIATPMGGQHHDAERGRPAAKMGGNGDPVLIRQPDVKQYEVELLGQYHLIELQRAPQADHVEPGLLEHWEENPFPELGIVFDYCKLGGAVHSSCNLVYGIRHALVDPRARGTGRAARRYAWNPNPACATRANHGCRKTSPPWRLPAHGRSRFPSS
jgi:hypothetical protein